MSIKTEKTPIPDRWFVQELAGENAPSFSELQNLYDLASQLWAQRPWNLLYENELVVVRSAAAGGQMCHCSVMGSLGQVYAVHAYIGDESLRAFRRMQAGKITEPGEFFASQHSVLLEYVARSELQKPDRDLLAAIGHPRGRVKCPIFRAIRPGFFPWFVTAEEAQILTECIRAVIVVCSAFAAGAGDHFWNEDEGVFPLVSRASSGESDYCVDSIRLAAAPEPPLVPIPIDHDLLSHLRGKGYTVRGIMELDHMFSSVTIGGKSERKACVCVALAVDAETGIVYAPEMTLASVLPENAMAQAFLKAVQSTDAFPREVRIRRQDFRDRLAPFLQSFDVPVRVARRLPAMDQARAELVRFFA